MRRTDPLPTIPANSPGITSRLARALRVNPKTRSINSRTSVTTSSPKKSRTNSAPLRLDGRKGD